MMVCGGTASLAPDGQACTHPTPMAMTSDDGETLVRPVPEGSSYPPLLTSPPPLLASTPPLPPFQIPHPTNLCLWPGCRCLQKEYLSFYDLDFHIKTYHTRQCPWPTCNTQRSFRRRSDLLRHMESVHSGARRFICDSPGCSKSYSRSDKLTAHRRTHSTTTSRRPVPDINARAFGIRDSIHMDIRGFSVSPTEPTQGQNSGPRTGPVEPSTELSPVQSKNSLGDSLQGPTYSFDQIRSSRTLANDSQMSYHTLLVRSDGSDRSNNPALCNPTHVPEDPDSRNGEDFPGAHFLLQTNNMDNMAGIATPLSNPMASGRSYSLSSQVPASMGSLSLHLSPRMNSIGLWDSAEYHLDFQRSAIFADNYIPTFVPRSSKFLVREAPSVAGSPQGPGRNKVLNT
jgi:hypothetical protein